MLFVLKSEGVVRPWGKGHTLSVQMARLWFLKPTPIAMGSPRLFGQPGHLSRCKELGIGWLGQTSNVSAAAEQPHAEEVNGPPAERCDRV